MFYYAGSGTNAVGQFAPLTVGSALQLEQFVNQVEIASQTPFGLLMSP
jgi:hypothetical protein